ncbi:hypothetical protein QP518_08440 [Peptoniphilus harei]|uniref:hypothetical protein n=1 Tax=Peptoniphilaceae TaxID=1570339 RepID=UPI000C06F829|nr:MULTISPECIES: hypothetical protein [Peptoniphilaceae]MDK7355775.1 hypothetical protein [Peptoniphilus harei]MDK7371406.1 hypothetical protein [Peptoniphilus harei]MDU2583562.1 hypothetical protein [Anaerococcus hydrogenalis]MDU3011036.1 hypothetical protein [Peptoniphilus harei]MDU7411374.1 hypothetical protein [Anaerococcus sp.]
MEKIITQKLTRCPKEYEGRSLTQIQTGCPKKYEEIQLTQNEGKCPKEYERRNLTQKFNECPKEYERRNKVDLVKNEQMAESLIAISIVAKKIAMELMQPEKGEKSVKNKATNGNQRRCRESCI